MGDDTNIEAEFSAENLPEDSERENPDSPHNASFVENDIDLGGENCLPEQDIDENDETSGACQPQSLIMNVGNVERDIIFADYIDQKDQKGRANQSRLYDPTTPFKFADTSKDYEIEEGFLAATKKIKTESFVLVACDDHLISMSAARQLIHHINRSETRGVRQFSTQSLKQAGSIRNTQDSPVSEDNFSLKFLQQNFSKIPKKTTIVIDLTSEYSIGDARQFLSELLNPTVPTGYFENLKKELHAYALDIICLAPQKIMSTGVNAHQVHVWQIDPIKILIYRNYPSEAKALFKTFSKQLALEQWGLESVVDDVRNAINQKTFLDLIDQYEKEGIQEEESDLQYFLSLLESDTPYATLTEAVLFTSLYFPKLSEPLFEDVLSILLGDAEVPDNQKDKTSNDVRRSGEADTDDNSGHPENNFHVTVKVNDADISVNTTGHDRSGSNNADSIKNPINTSPISEADTWHRDKYQYPLENQITLKELWFKGARKIISNNTKITVINVPNGRSYIGFRKPHLSKAASEALKASDPFYFSGYFDRILESGLVFHNSQFIADSALELIRQRMLRNPDLYDYRWLSEWVGKALIVIDIAEKIQPENVEQLDGQLQILASEPLLMERWTKLLRMMLSDERLSKVTNEFLTNLFNIRHYDRVLQFAIRLKDTPGFDILHWLKRLIAESNDEVREKTFYYMLNYYRINIFQKPGLLSNLIEWLPSDETGDNLPPLQQTALFLPTFLTVMAITEFDTNSQTMPSSIFPITPNNDMTTLSDIFDDLMLLLLHPRQGFDARITKDLLRLVAEKLLTKIRIPMPRQLDAAKDNLIFLPDLFLSLPSIQTRRVDGLLGLILVSWAWQLLANPKEKFAFATGENILNQITAVLVDDIPDYRLTNIRKFLRESRQMITNNKSKVGQKKKIQLLSRYVRTSRSVANSIYKNIKSETI